MRVYRESGGFTLIELMVTLALLGLVIAGGFSIYFFADRSFFSGSVMADVQADMQIAMLRITEEVRLAHSLELMATSDVPATVSHDDEHYLFVKDGSVFLRTKASPPDRLILQGDSAETGYHIAFERGSQAPNLIGITLSSDHPRVNYELASELQVLNLRTVGIKGAGPTGAIRFTKTFSEEELAEARRVNPRCLFRRYIFASDAPEIDQLRDFRDRHLASTPLGRLVIRAYYAVSPVVASYLDYQPLARIATTSFLRTLSYAVIRLT